MPARRKNPTPSLFPIPLITAADLAALNRLCDILAGLQAQLTIDTTAQFDPELHPNFVADAAALGALVIRIES